MTYSEKLRDPRWQKKRLEILERDEFMCCVCQDSEHQLHVHHKNYSKNTAPWDYPDSNFVTLCCECHEIVKYIQSYASNIAGFEPGITTLRRCVELLESPFTDEFQIVVSRMINNPELITKFYKVCLKDFSGRE